MLSQTQADLVVVETPLFNIINELQYQLLGIPQSALNGTEVEIRMLCGDDSDFEFQVRKPLFSFFPIQKIWKRRSYNIFCFRSDIGAQIYYN